MGRSAGEGIGYPLQCSWAYLIAQTVKNLPAMWETWVLFLVREDPLEKERTSHSSILAWKIPGKEFSKEQRSPAGYSTWDRKESVMTERLTQQEDIKINS